jgi:hypothetical protein
VEIPCVWTGNLFADFPDKNRTSSDAAKPLMDTELEPYAVESIRSQKSFTALSQVSEENQSPPKPETQR